MSPDGRSWKLWLVGACLLGAVVTAVLWWGARTGSDDPGAPPAATQVKQSEPTERARRQKVLPARGSPLRRETETPTPTPAPLPSPAATPTPAATDVPLLRLPALGVAAPIQTLPVTDTRTLDPPSDYTTVGLWPLGAQPGDAQGTSIIAGHTVHTGGGALDDLEQMAPGDEVVVERPGPDLSYRVESVTTYNKATLAEDTAAIFSQTVPGRLAVVTCEDWNGSIYLSNVVVIATPA